MRTTVPVPTVTIGLAVLFWILAASAPAFADGDRIAGFWNVHEQLLNGCPTGDPVRDIPDLNIFFKSGEFIEAAATPSVGSPPLQRVMPGLGTWAHAGGRHFTSEFRFFRYSAEDDTFAGVQIASKEIELGADGNSFTSTGTTDIFDANGMHLATRCSRGTAVRIK